MLKNPLYKTPLKFGLIGGLMAIVIFVFLYFLGQNPVLTNKKIPFGLILLPLFIFFSVKEYRDFRNQRQLRFWQGIVIGVINYLLIAIISAIFIWAFTTYIDKSLVDDMIAFGIQHLEKGKEGFIEIYGQEYYNQTVQSAKNTTAYHIALDDFVIKVLIGTLSTFIISIILRK